MIDVLNLIDLTDAQVDKLRAAAPDVRLHHLPQTPLADLDPALRDAVRVIFSQTRWLATAHELPHLEWVQVYSAGVDPLHDLPLWGQPRVKITSAVGIHAVPVAERALSMLLAFQYHWPELWHAQQHKDWVDGRWQRFATPELRGSTVGIIGYGAIGRELARQCAALGMRVLAVNRSGQRRPATGFIEPGLGDPDASIPDAIYPTHEFAALLPQCDHVVLLAPLTADTHHMMDAAALKQMKPTAILHNLGRGPLVDEAALVAALHDGTITGAGLDVFEQEPLPPTSPLWDMPNVMISPHIGGLSAHYDDRVSDLFAENLRRFLRDEPLINEVDRAAGY